MYRLVFFTRVTRTGGPPSPGGNNPEAGGAGTSLALVCTQKNGDKHDEENEPAPVLRSVFDSNGEAKAQRVQERIEASKLRIAPRG